MRKNQIFFKNSVFVLAIYYLQCKKIFKIYLLNNIYDIMKVSNFSPPTVCHPDAMERPNNISVLILSATSAQGHPWRKAERKV